LAADVYDRYDPKGPVNAPPIAEFIRISDYNTQEDANTMSRLFPGRDRQAVERLLAPDDSDFRAAIYEDRTAPRKIFLVFRGTVATSWSDWVKGNERQAAGVGSSYYSKAIFLAGQLKKSAVAQLPPFELELVGHSLGGGMADAAGAANRIKTISFNPSGVNPETVRGVDISVAPKYLTDYVVDGEPLNSHQDHPALTVADVYGASALGGGLTSTALAATSALDIANGGSAKDVLQEITTLYSAKLPTAIGSRVTLKPVQNDIYTFNPVRLHSMAAVVDAIVAHSRELYGQYLFNKCGSPADRRASF
jgi:hypothetical protein